MPEKAPTPPARVEILREERLRANYAAIESVLQASLRGRWFLAEYARRNRVADTELLLDAFTKLELAVLRPQHRHEARVLGELVEMREAIRRTRRQVAAIESNLPATTDQLDRIVAATEKAMSEILAATKEIQGIAGVLSEKGVAPDACDTLDRRVTDIYMACSFQDISGKQIEKLVRLLRFIEQRIDAMIAIWGEDPGFKLDSPARPAPRPVSDLAQEGASLKQAEIDAMLKSIEAEIEAKRQALAAEPAAPASVQASAPHQKPSATQPEGSMAKPEHPPGAGPTTVTVGTARFERPEPLTPATLQAVKREALFG